MIQNLFEKQLEAAKPITPDLLDEMNRNRGTHGQPTIDESVIGLKKVFYATIKKTDTGKAIEMISCFSNEIESTFTPEMVYVGQVAPESSIPLFAIGDEAFVENEKQMRIGRA